MLLSLPILVLGLRSEANDGILKRLLHHGDSAANATVVKIPAQEIRIETTKPNVIVNNVTGSGNRGGSVPGSGRVTTRGAARGGPNDGRDGPFIATILTGHGSFGSPAPSAGNQAMRAILEMELQAAEVAKHRAAHKAEMEELDRMHQRVRGGLTGGGAAPSADVTELKASIDSLNKRLSDIERLLIIHDNILKDLKEVKDQKK